MAGKKKGDSSAALIDTTTTPPQDEAAVAKGAGANSDDISVDTVTEGQHDVDLLDLGIPAEDIAAMRRIDARLEEVRRAKQQELQAGPSEPQMVTRAKGKETMLSKAERQEQYNKLKEEELHCRAMQKKLKEQRQMLEKCKHHHSRGRLPQPTHDSTRHPGFAQ